MATQARAIAGELAYPCDPFPRLKLLRSWPNPYARLGAAIDVARTSTAAAAASLPLADDPARTLNAPYGTRALAAQLPMASARGVVLGRGYLTSDLARLEPSGLARESPAYLQMVFSPGVRQRGGSHRQQTLFVNPALPCPQQSATDRGWPAQEPFANSLSQRPQTDKRALTARSSACSSYIQPDCYRSIFATFHGAGCSGRSTTAINAGAHCLPLALSGTPEHKSMPSQSGSTSTTGVSRNTTDQGTPRGRPARTRRAGCADLDGLRDRAGKLKIRRLSAVTISSVSCARAA